ncbi:nucleotidyltransferase family protein [Pseudonocardia hydrocarbonoxydans]|uniref:MobA-like NTP transferase domain-containing protein n=2 Tax=Pseudonocardia hydrocarbonoxydans TaxID=76726 RepID=A0A4Y3WT25_9PSEU|nr:hypothetical protein PHY01_31920 [Pseudonocardia hydrocarbonoxydans]
MGRPKALVELHGEPLVRRALRVLADGGCGPLVVVLGAAADEVRAQLPDGVRAVVADDWASGMGASLRAGLAVLDSDAALVHLVDLPGVTAAAVERLVADPVGPHTLRRAAYGGRAAHPVLLGRDHWDAVATSATGDAGARAYLGGHPDVELVECGDVAVPEDVDTPEALARFAGS